MRRRPRNPVPPAITTRGRVSLRCAVFMGIGVGGSVAAEAEEGEDLVAEFHGFLDAGGGHAAHFVEPRGAEFEEAFEVFETLAGVGVGGVVGVGMGDAVAEEGDGGIDLAFFAFGGDDAEHFEDVFEGFEVVAAVAGEVDDLDDTPVLEFAETVADVGAGDPEGVADVFGVAWGFAEIEEGVDLGHGAVDAPAGAHFAPVEDEFLGGGGERVHG